MAQVLETIIAINAHVGNGFSAVGTQLTQLGTLVNGMSSQLIDFGKESVEVYKDYEKSMAEVEGVYAKKYGKNTLELSNVMKSLDESATEWAASTIFHTDDIANAINLAAHAGWEYDEVLTGIPSAIELAQAGSMDLSEAVDYITKATHAAGIEFESIPSFIDMWSYAASSSATDIEQMGQAMTRMGRTMQFAGGSEELLTMLAILGDAGTVGSDAGTLLRNSMLRLVAPTDKAKDAMSELGFEAEELDEALSDDAYLEAYEQLEKAGFSAYDEYGNLKNMVQVFEDLDAALESINNDKEASEILSAIFPTRSLSGALALLDGARNDWNGLYDDLEKGKAEGYGGFLQELMGETLWSKTEIFESKIERLKQVVGEELSTGLENTMGYIGGIVDSIAGLDEGALSALVNGAKVLAVAGPGLLTVGGAFRLIGAVIGSPAALMGVAAISAGALAASLNELERVDYENLFGTGSIDTTEISQVLSTLQQDFKSAYSDINAFKTELEGAEEAYKTASQTLSSQLLSKAITENKISKEDLDSFEALGTQMYLAVEKGISSGAAVGVAYWEMLNGGSEDIDPHIQNIISMIGDDMDDQLAEAGSISQKIHDKLMEGYENGFTSDDYNEILGFFQEYNRLISEAEAAAKGEEQAIQRQMMLNKAQTASYAEIEAVGNEIAARRDEELEILKNDYEYNKAAAEYRYDQAIAEGRKVLNSEMEWVDATYETKAADLAYIEGEYQRKSAELTSSYDAMEYRLWDTNARQSDLGEAYSDLSTLAGRVMSGEVLPEVAMQQFRKEYGKNQYAGDNLMFGEDKTRTHLSQLINDAISDIGGLQELDNQIEKYNAIGDTETAGMLSNLRMMQYINDEGATTKVTSMGEVWSDILGETAGNLIGSAASWFNADKQYMSTGRPGPGISTAPEQLITDTYSLDNARSTIESLGDGEGSLRALFDAAGQAANGLISENEYREAYNQTQSEGLTEFGNMIAILSNKYDLDKVYADTSEGANVPEETGAYKDLYSAYQLLYGGIDTEAYRIQPELDYTSLPDMGTTAVDIEPHIANTDAIAELQGQGIEVNLQANNEQIIGAIDSADGETITTYLNADATDIDATLRDEEGKEITFHGNTEELEETLSGFEGQTIFFNITGESLLTPEIDYSSMGDLPEIPGTIVIEAVEGADAEQIKSDLEEIGATVEVDGETGELHAQIEAENSQQLLEYVDGNPDMLHAAIVNEDGQTLTEYVDGDTNAIESRINALDGHTITINIATNGSIPSAAGFATGGRAEQPSIFGEAGPEWAIPEEHTENTRNLLAKAAEASGFSLMEIAGASNGGSSSSSSSGSDGGSSNTTIVYSPTINAANVEGVERALGDDKKAFVKYMKEKLMFDKMEVYT